jgi:predicted GTPase
VEHTSGTNAVIRHHERLTDDFVPRSDLVLFVTSADRPMSESERQFLERIRTWGKKVVMTLNKIDILDSPAALNEVRDFVLRHAEQVLGFMPDGFPYRRGWLRQPRPKRPGEAHGCAKTAAWTR